jgi:hypothetical protein
MGVACESLVTRTGEFILEIIMSFLEHGPERSLDLRHKIGGYLILLDVGRDEAALDVGTRRRDSKSKSAILGELRRDLAWFCLLGCFEPERIGCESSSGHRLNLP